MKVYIERNTFQLELIRYRTQCPLLFTFPFSKQRIQCNIAHRTHIRNFRTEPLRSLSFLNGITGLWLLTLHSFSDSPGRFAVVNQCTASVVHFKTMVRLNGGQMWPRNLRFPAKINQVHGSFVKLINPA